MAQSPLFRIAYLRVVKVVHGYVGGGSWELGIRTEGLRESDVGDGEEAEVVEQVEQVEHLEHGRGRERRTRAWRGRGYWRRDTGDG
jgi:hypothetical protein